MAKEKKIYPTTNFNIAVWLMMNGKNPQEINWPDKKKRATFLFEDFQDRDTLVQDFFKQDQLQNFISNSQELKSRLYSVRSPVEYERDR